MRLHLTRLLEIVPFGMGCVYINENEWVIGIALFAVAGIFNGFYERAVRDDARQKLARACSKVMRENDVDPQWARILTEVLRKKVDRSE